jgi:hemolysin III
MQGVTAELTAAVPRAPREADDLIGEVGQRVCEVVEELKPRLRGWLHASVAPIALLTLVAAVGVTEEPRARVGAGVFLATAVLMFTTSALFHTRRWSERAFTTWQRLDHANIFVLIAGSCTPFTLMILDGARAAQLLTLVWAGALAGALFKILWIDAPRGLSVALYLLLGSTSLLFAREFVVAGPPQVLALALAGGISYAMGGLVYGFRWPNPVPATFGYHEVFHALTIAGFTTHCIGVGLLLRG